LPTIPRRPLSRFRLLAGKEFQLPHNLVATLLPFGQVCPKPGLAQLGSPKGWASMNRLLRRPELNAQGANAILRLIVSPRTHQPVIA
jgi:hypothetical protein